MSAREEAERAVLHSIAAVLPEVPRAELLPERSLVDLGATSIDRVEVALGAMEALGLVLRPAEFAGVGTIGGLIELLHSRMARG